MCGEMILHLLADLEASVPTESPVEGCEVMEGKREVEGSTRVEVTQVQ